MPALEDFRTRRRYIIISVIAIEQQSDTLNPAVHACKSRNNTAVDTDTGRVQYSIK